MEVFGDNIPSFSYTFKFPLWVCNEVKDGLPKYLNSNCRLSSGYKMIITLTMLSLWIGLWWLEQGCNLISSHHRSAVLRSHTGRWVLVEGEGKWWATAVEESQTVVVICGTALSLQIRAASGNVPYFSALRDPFSPQLPKLCHPSSHAHWPAVLWPWGYRTVCKTNCFPLRIEHFHRE